MEETRRAGYSGEPRDVAKQFVRDGYGIKNNLVGAAAREFLVEYALKSWSCGKLRAGDAQFPNTPCSSADPLMNSLMVELLPRIEEASGYKLYPTYSYLRVYQQGDILRRHTDRPACEISVTLNLGYKASEPWPICIERNEKSLSIRLHPGDALLYKGIEVPHWRERFEGEYAVQVFLHYVDQNGPYREWIYDKGNVIADSPIIRSLISSGLENSH